LIPRFTASLGFRGNNSEALLNNMKCELIARCRFPCIGDNCIYKEFSRIEGSEVPKENYANRINVIDNKKGGKTPPFLI
jgi:hypothetical protein